MIKKSVQRPASRQANQPPLKNSHILQPSAGVIQFESLTSPRSVKWRIVLGLVVALLFFFTIILFVLLKVQYQQHTASLVQNAQVVQRLTPVLKQQQESVPVRVFSLEPLDLLMAVRQNNMQFDRVRLSRQIPLQVEGVTSQPLDVGTMVEIAGHTGLKLEIRQVQAEHKDEIKFELRGVS